MRCRSEPLLQQDQAGGREKEREGKQSDGEKRAGRSEVGRGGLHESTAIGRVAEKPGE